MDVPPGWRDDDLIEVYTFSQRILETGPVLYFAGASGHEPLYHTLRAPIIAFAGINQASARWLSAVAGTLTTILTWTVGRRVIGRHAGLVGAGLVAISFWSLMYSRVAIRHIGMLPWALVAVYWGWRMLRGADSHTRRSLVGIAIGVGGAVLTYYAGRLIPVAARPDGSRCSASVGVAGAPTSPQSPLAWRWPCLCSPQPHRRPGLNARVGELAIPIHALSSRETLSR